jgi:dihydroorotate dehydrogenase
MACKGITKSGQKMKYLRAVMYTIVRKFFFLFDAEAVHHFAMDALRFFCSWGPLRRLIANRFRPASDPLTQWGLPFQHRVGLAAGFDKNAKYLRELEALGFGHVEIGTVTPLPQAGNDKPRLFRLPADQALINRMGFNNDGVKAIAARLKSWKSKETNPYLKHRLLVGGNIGKNKVTPNEEAWKDYDICFRELFDYVDYFVVNVSSPNTPGLRELQEKESLRKILSHLQTLNRAQPHPKPLLLKIAPDLSLLQVDDVIDLALEIKLDGLVSSNTTISREGLNTPPSVLEKIGAGGLSGKPLTERSTALVNYIATKTKGQLPIIASGGIFTAEDARQKLEAGACLVQVWTGFIYVGPGIVKKISLDGEQ